MTLRLFAFRHSETFDNCRGIFSGWRDSGLTPKGIAQAKEIAQQLEQYRIEYAFTSHLERARRTLDIVLQKRPPIQVFTDDRLIERCYGILQGKSKRRVAHENFDQYIRIHRGYDFAPPDGESLRMVENRVLSFLGQLEKWSRRHPGNVAISCHSNSMRPFRRVFEHLSRKQMLQLETPQDSAIIYEVSQHYSGTVSQKEQAGKIDWKGVVISRKVKLATDPLNLLKIFYA